MSGPDPRLADRLATPPYHQALRAHLEATEPELWAWFRESADPTDDQIAQSELELLKTTYRLDGDVHDVLTGLAPVLAGQLGLDHTIALYQELGTNSRNARVMRLADTIHVVFSGDLLDLLDPDEQRAVLAHELAHIALLDRDDRAYFTLDHLIHRADVEAVDSMAISETARRLRLHTEVWADAIAVELVGEAPVVRAIVKLESGLRNVDADAYLRQARQIVEADPSASQGWSHPEVHVRVACVAARSAPGYEGIVHDLIDGPDDLDRLDLLGQLRQQVLTARLLAAARSNGARADAANYVRNYPELDVAGADTLDDGELAEAMPSIRHYAAALLVDLALDGDVFDGGDAGGDDARGLATLGRWAVEASRIGVEKEFEKILGRATERSVADVRKLRADHAARVAEGRA